MPNIRDVYTAIIYFKGRTGNNKPRPVVILNAFENNMFTVAEVTGTSPDKTTYFSSFKEPILLWNEAGLDRPSWVKCYKGNVHNINGSRLHQYIGIMDNSDWENAVMSIYYNNP